MDVNLTVLVAPTRLFQYCPEQLGTIGGRDHFRSDNSYYQCVLYLACEEI
jgi:hypothetical protein